ncbi:tetratricopeptide repeat protein [Devosia nitrariae]|uniref:Tetratricopeptide repeat protein n=1 Tax=Devosia nitrariae TaxID=2071872 RepID=A0ABQ5WBY9_9HYPH|nr:hypothetical protein [Devosia nitrariae]GLQ57337.1 hypothetical protein GCM10010862_45960 [Devosia nitrariae]
MGAFFKSGCGKAAAGLAVGAAVVLSVQPAPVFGLERARLFVTQEEGYGRLVLGFPDRDKLPPYYLRMDNGVLSIEFEDEVSVVMPDVEVTLPDYISIARVDPDLNGVRFALRGDFNFNSIEAGERLFVDLLPLSWRGLPPSLPQEIIDELAERARLAAIEAERQRKARDVAELNPAAEVRIGRNPTFLRLQFNWNVDTTAAYEQVEDEARIAFEWPVDVDLMDLALDLPVEIASVESETTPDGAVVSLKLAEGIEPRFFQNSSREFLLDVDLAGVSLPKIGVEDLAAEAGDAQAAEAAEASVESAASMPRAMSAEPVTPFVTVVGTTARIVFPFEEEVPAAVFRRGDTLWMLFDTDVAITAPEDRSNLGGIAGAFEVTPAGDAQVVRIALSGERLATLGSEGRAWVLSLGDLVLAPTEPVGFARRLGLSDLYEMTADMARPVRVHEFRDPQVGDVLKIVTAYPPARGVTRTFDYVDFDALRSIHGLVLRPEHEGVGVRLEGGLAVVSAEQGLTVSSLDQVRRETFFGSAARREGFIDLTRLTQGDPAAFAQRRKMLMAQAAEGEGRARDIARLELAQFYVANRFAHEALGVLRMVGVDFEARDVLRKIRMTQAIANTLAGRPQEAITILQSPLLATDVDALLWRAIARVDASDFKGGRQDAQVAEPVLDSYPTWVKARFRLAAVRAAVETGDAGMAKRLFEAIDFAELNLEQTSLYHLLEGRLAELEGRPEDAMDMYGQVIAADIRPTRAEAIYRTLQLLDGADNLDAGKAAETLAAEAMLWRGGPLEAEMQKMLTDLYYREGAYRQGFETVRQAMAASTESAAINAMRDEAQRVFADLFLNGRADTLAPVDALGLYYDFRQLTPPGARGDEMIRNLARRLIRVDLLGQAAELLQYQLENRLRGVARSQIAADLAVVYLADRRPQDALRVLTGTRLPDISTTLARQRRVLEARALIEVGRHELALDMIRDMSGRDIDLMRIEANWKAGRYEVAAGMLEAIYSPETGPLTQAERMSIVKAAVGFVLADDRLGVSRLRSKFGERLVTTPEWAMFDYVTSAIQPTSLEFRQVAREVAAIDGLNAFLASYRQVYESEGALAPAQASQAQASVASR